MNAHAARLPLISLIGSKNDAASPKVMPTTPQQDGAQDMTCPAEDSNCRGPCQ